MRTYDTPMGELPSVTWILGESVTKPWMPNYIKKWARECLWDMVNTRLINRHEGNRIFCKRHEWGKGGTMQSIFECPDCSWEDAFIPHIEISDIQYCLDAHKRHSEKALEIGSLVHSCIEVFFKEWCNSVPDEEDFCWYSEFIDEYYPEIGDIFVTFMKALHENRIKVLESEQTVWHPMGYAGTLDLICEMDDKLWIGDIKTFESDVEWKAFKTKAYKKWESGECEKKPRAFRTAETKEELKEILEKATKNGTEYTLIEEVDKPLFKKEHYAQTRAYMEAYNYLIKNQSVKEGIMGWINSDGYAKAMKDGKEEYIHRIIMEEKIGRPLDEGECVHHINGDRSDNHPDNLELISYSEHGKLHPRECKSIIGDSKRCPRCDKWLPFTDFSKNKNRVGGLASYCKQCEKDYKKEKYFGHSSKQRLINNRFILWLDKRDQSNYYLEIIEEKDNEKHWDMWCTAFNQWKAWK